ncbi:MAG TPA: hypothetical protein VJX66_13505, partial [Amycolatopsis sp.]|nr:hypothetical protein [Amycolatopsis sp.]
MAKHTPISLQHQFFCAMDKGDDEGVFGPRHTNTNAWRLHGQLDLDIFQEALFDVVKRHSILHTSLIRGDDPYYETT